MHSPAALHSTSPLDVLHPKPPWPLPAVETPSALVQAISTWPRVWVPLSMMTLAEAAPTRKPRSVRKFPHLASSRKPGGMTWSVMHERRGPWERTPGPEVGGAESTPGYEKSPVAAFRPLVVVAYASITVLLSRDHARSTARRLRSASEQWTRAALCVARRTTRGAWPASNASCQRDAHKHQRSPGFRPGKPNSGIGVERSLPRDLEKSRNAAVITAQTVWQPMSSCPVLQHPSR